MWVRALTVTASVINFFKFSFLKTDVKAPFVGPKSKKFPKGLEVIISDNMLACTRFNHPLKYRSECSQALAEASKSGISPDLLTEKKFAVEPENTSLARFEVF